jgi:hypothetical protein
VLHIQEDGIRQGFVTLLANAESQREPLPIELRFGHDSDPLVALPWELLHLDGRFLVADSSVALIRYPEGAIPLTKALADLPLRVLLVLPQPLDATPVLSEEARRELLHALRRLDEEGAVIVDELRPPTYDVLRKAERFAQPSS